MGSDIAYDNCKSQIRNWIQFPVDSLSAVVSPRLDLKVPWTPNLSHDQPSSSVRLRTFILECFFLLNCTELDFLSEELSAYLTQDKVHQFSIVEITIGWKVI